MAEAFGAAEEAVGDFVRTGKVEFGSFVTSLLADMAELSVQKMVLTPLSNALDSFLGGLGGGGGAAAAPAAAASSGGGAAGSSAASSAAAAGWWRRALRLAGRPRAVGRRPRRRSFLAAPAAGRWRRGCPIWWASWAARALRAGPGGADPADGDRAARCGAAADARRGGGRRPGRGGGQPVVNVSITTPDVESFRRSRTQVAARHRRARWLASDRTGALMAFHEVRFPDDISRGARGGPERRTQIVELASRRRGAQRHWAHSRRRYDAAYGIRRADDLAAVVAFFEARHGAAPRLPLEGLGATTSPACRRRPRRPTDQPLGVGDGTTTEFQLVKAYASGAQS